MAALHVQELVPSQTWIAAPEPLVFQADRRGCRLEFSDAAAARAASEWGEDSSVQVACPLDLIEFYRHRGARYVADVGPEPSDHRRKALHEAIRQRYKVLVDCASVIIAELNPIEISGHGQ
jgi:hypothetical protein